MLANCKSTGNIEATLQEFYRKRIVRVSIVQFLSRLAVNRDHRAAVRAQHGCAAQGWSCDRSACERSA